MPSSQKVTLVHKDLPDQPITVSESAVRIHEKSGWRRAPKSQQPPESEKS